MAGKTEYKNKWVAERCDRVNLVLPKGRKAEIQIAAEAERESLNGFITAAINDRMSAFDAEQARADAVTGDT